MATQALVPKDWREALAGVAKTTGTHQSHLVALAVERLLVRAELGFTPDTPPMPRGSLVALVARIPEEQQRALRALAERTHILYSAWLRHAVVDVLREHGAMPEAPPPVHVARPGRPRSSRCACGFRLLPGEQAPCQDCREVAAGA